MIYRGNRIRKISDAVDSIVVFSLPRQAGVLLLYLPRWVVHRSRTTSQNKAWYPFSSVLQIVDLHKVTTEIPRLAVFIAAAQCSVLW